MKPIECPLWLALLPALLLNTIGFADESYFLHPPGTQWGLLGPTNFGVRAMAVTPDGAVVAGQHFTVFDDTNDTSWPGILRIAGDTGAVLSSTNYPDSGPYSYAHDIVPVVTGGGVLEGFVLAGQKNYYEGAYGGPWIWLVKTDPNLVWQWQAHTGTVAQVGAAQAVARRGDSFLVGGWDAYSAGGSKAGWLGRFDVSGTLVGAHADGVGGWPINGIEAAADGGYLLATDRAVTKLNASLETQWTAGEFPEMGYWNAYQTARPAAGGHIFGLAYRMQSTPGLPLNMGSVVTRLGSGGGVEWSQFYPDAKARDLVPTPDGGALIAGVKADGLNGGSDLWLFKIKADGSRGWEMSLGGEGDDAGNAIEADPSGDYFVAGSGWVDGEYRLWVFKVAGDLQPATPAFTVSPASPVFHDQEVTFDASGSTPPPGGAIDSYLWDLGDGTTTNGLVVAHRYHASGTNTVTLTVVTSDGVFSQAQQEVQLIGLAIQWERQFGSHWQDVGNSFVQTEDGGFLIAGATDSSYTEHNHLWLIKTDRRGRVGWDRFYDGPIQGSEAARCIIPAHDEGYMIVGDCSYYSNYWRSDPIFLKVDEAGEPLIPLQFLGTSSLAESAASVAATLDGGYIVLGTGSTNGTTSPWLVKLNGDGSPQWERHIEVTYGTGGNWVAPAADGGYVVAGESLARPAPMFKIDATGALMWTNYFSQYARLNWVGPPTPLDDGFVLVGMDNYDISMKFLDSTGAVVKAQSWSGVTTRRRADEGNYATPTPDGGYLVVGQVYVESHIGAPYEVALIKTDSEGEEHWMELLPGTTNVSETGIAAMALDDGSCVVLGRRDSGDARIWLFRVAANHPPVADLNLPIFIANTNAPLSFDASGSTDRDGTVVLCEWDFGDGQATNGMIVQHSYPIPGSYVVRLTAVDDDDAEHTISNSVFVIGIVVPDSNFVLEQFSVTNAPENDPANFPKPGAPPGLDWTSALGFHLRGTAASSTTRTIRATFEETLPTNGFTLYQLPGWTPADYTRVDDHTLEVQVHTPYGPVELSFVLAASLPAPRITVVEWVAGPRLALSFTTEADFQYAVERTEQIGSSTWGVALHSLTATDPLTLDTLDGSGAEETVFVDAGTFAPAFFRIRAERAGP